MKLIRERFVPVAITLHGVYKDAEGDFWKSLYRQGGWGTGRCHGVTPSGKMLCGGGGKPGCGGSSCPPQKALDRWRALPQEERRPGAVEVEDLKEMDPAFPKRPSGSLILKGYNRPLQRRADGTLGRLQEYRDCQELSKEAPHWKTFVDPEPGRVFLWFTREQGRMFLPADPRVGVSYPVDPAVAGRLARLTLLNTIF